MNWRDTTLETSDHQIVSARWRYQDIAGYRVVAVTGVSNAVGLAFCAPEDQLPHFNPSRSLYVANKRRLFKYQADWTVEQYVRLAMLIKDYPVPGKVVRAMKKNGGFKAFIVDIFALFKDAVTQ